MARHVFVAYLFLQTLINLFICHFAFRFRSIRLKIIYFKISIYCPQTGINFFWQLWWWPHKYKNWCESNLHWKFYLLALSLKLVSPPAILIYPATALIFPALWRGPLWHVCSWFAGVGPKILFLPADTFGLFLPPKRRPLKTHSIFCCCSKLLSRVVMS